MYICYYAGLSPPAPPTNVVLLVGVSLGTLFLVLIVTVISIAIIITITYIYKRSIKRKRGELEMVNTVYRIS